MPKIASMYLPVVLALTWSASGCILRNSRHFSPTPATPSPTTTPTTTPSPSAAPSAAPSTAATTPGKLTPENDVIEYAKLCKRELGIEHLPTLPHWNCLEGKEVPTTIQGLPLDADNYRLLTQHKIACDTPSWLGAEPCSNYGFVTHRTLAPNVEAYLICRDQKFTNHRDKAGRLAEFKASPGADSFNSLYAFDSLGMIWTNTKTGKTCFFDFVGTVYGGYIPSPDDDHIPDYHELPDPKPPTELSTGTIVSQVWKRNARGTWRSPEHLADNDACIMCHDTGALKGTPWVETVMSIPANPMKVPMILVGKSIIKWKDKYPVKAISTAPVTVNGKTEPQICTTCHRIGNLATCNADLGYSIGAAIPSNLPSTTAKDFFHRVWMPPAPESWKGKSDSELGKLWNDAYGPHVKRLMCCCKNPNAINCTSQDILAFPLPDPVPGKGPEVCS